MWFLIDPVQYHNLKSALEHVCNLYVYVHQYHLNMHFIC